MARKLIPLAILGAALTFAVQGHTFDQYPLSLLHESMNATSGEQGRAGVRQTEQEERRAPTYSPGGYDMSGVRVHRIRSVRASTFHEKKPGVEIELYNPNGHWYVGGLEWVLWIGEAEAMRGTCNTGMQGETRGTACFGFSLEEWKKFKQGAPLVLTWGFNQEGREQTIPFGKLNKKMLGKKPKHRI